MPGKLVLDRFRELIGVTRVVEHPQDDIVRRFVLLHDPHPAPTPPPPHAASIGISARETEAEAVYPSQQSLAPGAGSAWQLAR